MIHSGKMLYGLICYGLFVSGLFVGTAAPHARGGLLANPQAVDSVIAGLQHYIPARMQADAVPGLSIALVQNHRIIWTEGFGVKNRLTGKAVTPKTVFEAASISKVITAYTALRLVEEGKLTLDNPVHALLKKSWIESSAFADKITLRHLLSHSSGLGDDVLFGNKHIAFQPGTEFLYSGLGFEYVRELIEQVSDKSLEEVAKEKVFGPLGMTGSSFVDKRPVMAYMANGHMPYMLPFLAFLLPFMVILMITGIIILILTKVIKGTFRPALSLKAGALVFVLLLTGMLLHRLIGTPFPNLVWTSLLLGMVFILFMILLYLLYRRLLLLIGREKNLGTAITTLWMIFAIIIFATIVNRLTGPVPKNFSATPSAVGSLKSTAPDLAALLIELSRPLYLNNNLASQIDSAQVQINEDFSWGLGIGIQHTRHGDAIWQNAITFAFRGIMVIYPQQGYGVVVLTNSETGLPVACDIAERALGGEAKYKYF